MKVMITIDNADMTGSQVFLKELGKDSRYQLESMFIEKVVLINIDK